MQVAPNWLRLITVSCSSSHCAISLWKPRCSSGSACSAHISLIHGLAASASFPRRLLFRKARNACAHSRGRRRSRCRRHRPRRRCACSCTVFCDRYRASFVARCRSFEAPVEMSSNSSCSATRLPRSTTTWSRISFRVVWSVSWIRQADRQAEGIAARQ